VGSIYLLKEKAQTSMEQDGSGCIGVVATRVKQDNWLVLNTDLIYHIGHNNICTTLTFFLNLFNVLSAKTFEINFNKI
jgi:hypothetical protein